MNLKRPQNPIYFDLQPADQSLIIYSTPKNTTKHISIQNNVSFAKSLYWSIVDRTLNIKQTSTSMNLWTIEFLIILIENALSFVIINFVLVSNTLIYGKWINFIRPRRWDIYFITMAIHIEAGARNEWKHTLCYSYRVTRYHSKISFFFLSLYIEAYPFNNEWYDSVKEEIQYEAHQ